MFERLNDALHERLPFFTPRFVSVPDSVEELCEECFCVCKSLSRVAFGESSSLKLIWKWAFSASGVVEIHILG